MTGLSQYVTGKKESLADGENGRMAKFWLPSEVESSFQDAVCMEDIMGMEERLQEASCLDALHSIHSLH